ncbi:MULTISPECIES: Crp/Fnr family transcriptional regulator [Empedobacter]|uniref:Cyclic nucleotide-binding domain-containing protein n=2 Tax=Empedobacter falsenii TaxID=343874 RepID=A0A7H9DS74_9FLAO|nr:MULTISPECIES: cyclic nucleotide-binding domain-containing protein [Empedobacter]QLL57910.1 cyclic nucleotide-binding domain-containing protein [Empedobacter falsenii]
MLIDKDLLFEFGATQQTYKPGEFIIKKGITAKFYLQIQSGKVKRKNYQHEKIVLETQLSKGQSLGESFLFSEDLYTITIQAMVDCDILKLEKVSFHNLLEKHPHLYGNICKCMSEKLFHKFIMIQHLSIRKLGIDNYK